MELRQTRSRELALVALLATLCLGSRLATRAAHCEDWDGGSFALALEDYDLERLRPHFPGYPVYLAAASAVRPLTGDDVEALILVSAIFGAVAVVPLHGLARELFGERTAFLSALLYTANPAIWLASGKVGSDATGLAFVLGAAWALARAARAPSPGGLPAIAGAGLGLALGVRLGLAPALVPFWIVVASVGSARGDRRFAFRAALGLVAGILIWLVPLAALVGPGRLASLGAGFVSGHFTDWGGSVGTRPGLLERAGDFAWLYLAAGLGSWWPDASMLRLVPSALLAVGLIAFLRGALGSPSARALVATLAILGLWAFLAQNLSRPRHVLPLVPWTLVAAAHGLDRIVAGRRLAFAALAIAAAGPALVDSAVLARANARTLPPPVCVVRRVAEESDRRIVRCYVWETRRLFEYYEPDLDARRARDLADLDRDLLGSWVLPDRIFVTSKVAGAPGEADGWTRIARYRTSRYLHAPYDDLSIYVYEPPFRKEMER